MAKSTSRAASLAGVTLMASALFATPASAEDAGAEDAAYKAIIAMTQLTLPDPKSDDCNVKGVVVFMKYADKLPVFREAFLNQGYSIDFYNQRRKQVLSYVVLKRAAELITEGMYNGKSQSECHFSLTVSYPDKFGQERNFEALT